MKRLLSTILGLGLLSAIAVPIALQLWRQPLQSVRVTGSFVNVSQQELEDAIAPHLPPAFLLADVSAIRRAARAIAWVDDVSVRRVWPDRLDVEVREREAVARWRGRTLLEADASLFEPERLKSSAMLPWLEGPPGRHRQVLERWRQLDEIAQEYMNVRVTRLGAQVRGVWVAELSNGIVVQLATDTFEDDLPRYARAFPRALGSHLDDVEVIDLRYGNGFAVRWREEEDAGEGVGA